MRFFVKWSLLLAFSVMGITGCDTSTGTTEAAPAAAHDTTLRVLRFGDGAYSIQLKPGVVDYVSDSVSSSFAQVAINAVPTDQWARVTCDSISCNNWFVLSDSETLVRIKVENGISSLMYQLRIFRKRFVQHDSDFGIPWNVNATYGELVDSRDGQKYKTVRIGNQVWMAQNLNYVTYGSFAYSNSSDSSAKYGRNYTWYSAMGAPTYETTIPPGIRGVCPSGWHMPSDTEWTTLEQTARTVYSGSPLKALQSTSGWGTNGTDNFGFRLLPAGYGNPKILKVGSETQLLSRTLWGNQPKVRWAYDNANYFQVMGGAVETYFSVRCIQD